MKPDTSPQRLQMTRDYITLRMRFEAKRIRGIDRMVVDLIAMVDALEAQVRDLTQPEEEFHPVHLNAWAKTDPDPACRRCQGRGWYKKDVLGVEDAVVAVAYYHCPLCDPLGKIPFPMIPDETRAADPTQP